MYVSFVFCISLVMLTETLFPKHLSMGIRILLCLNGSVHSCLPYNCDEPKGLDITWKFNIHVHEGTALNCGVFSVEFSMR